MESGRASVSNGALDGMPDGSCTWGELGVARLGEAHPVEGTDRQGDREVLRQNLAPSVPSSNGEGDTHTLSEITAARAGVSYVQVVARSRTEAESIVYSLSKLHNVPPHQERTVRSGAASWLRDCADQRDHRWSRRTADSQSSISGRGRQTAPR